jgi:hypothetical protein
VTKAGRDPRDPSSPKTLQGVSPVERIMYRLHRAGIDTEPGKCWPWPGSKNSAGYGRMVTSDDQYVHRIMYKGTVGPIPEGMELDHKCRNRSCCNPAHVEPVARQENHLRRRHDATGEPCHRGHAYEATPGNGCRQCRNEYMREYNRNRRAQLKAAGQTA